MKTKQINSWGPRSASYWLTALVAVGIILLGLRFMLAPNAGATGFGIPLQPTREAIAYGWIKGIRDIYAGIAVLIFLILRKPRSAAFAFGAAIIIPVSDFFTVLSINGTKDLSHLLIHGITALYMIVTSIFLFKAEPKN